MFDRDPAAGTLTLQQPLNYIPELGGGVGAVAAVMSPDGKHVYVLSPSDELFVFDRDPVSGAATLLHVYDDLTNTPDVSRQPTAMAIGGGGTSLYVVGNDPLGEQSCGAVSAFARDTGDGSLTKVDTDVLPAGACPGGGAVAVSPDGTNVYVAGENVIQVYERDLGDGSLTDQQLAPSSLLQDSRSDIVVAPDGTHVYVATNASNRTVCNPACLPESHFAFARDVSGDLTLLQATDAKALSHVAIDGTGEYVLFADDRGRVLLYDRSVPSGLLTLSDTVEFSSQGLQRPAHGLELSPDGRHVYANIDRAIIVIQLTCGDGTVDPGESCDDGNTSAADGCSPRCAIEPCWSCSSEPSSCTVVSDGTACDDGSACTVADACSGGICAGSAEPDPTCRIPANAKITMKERRTSSTIWKWNRGSTLVEDFGDPLATTDYTLCIYDASARPQPIAELEPPRFCAGSASSCWSGNGDLGFEYTDYSRYPFRSISLRASASGGSRILIKATTIGAPLDELPTLPLVTPVTVQLKTSEGECWQSTHSGAKANSDSKFSAR